MYIAFLMRRINDMYEIRPRRKILILLCLSVTITFGLSSTAYSGFSSLENKTLTQPWGTQSISNVTNSSNIVLVHGSWGDGSVWSKIIPILNDAGHNVIAVQLPLHSLGDDIATVERAIERVGGPTLLVGHSYGGIVITNAGHNNSNVTGLVYLAAFAPEYGESLLEQGNNTADLPANLITIDDEGFALMNPDLIHEWFAQDVDQDEVDIMTAVQKPTNQLTFIGKSGSPAWKQLPTWYQISENDRVVPPDYQHHVAERMNATIVSLNASHFSQISQPEKVAELILNAIKGK
jgi:pimeloyl-ACP methyl ester carboxylesterase